MSKLLCFFGNHTYELLSVHHYYDTSWGGNAQSTNVTRMCKCCGKLKTKDMYGVGFIPKDKFK